MFDILQYSPIFKGHTPIEIKTLFTNEIYQVIDFKKGDLIISRDEECNKLIILIKGNVKGEMLSYSGKVIKIEDIQAPRPLAIAFLFGRNNKFPVDIIAIDDVKIIVLPKNTVVKFIQKSEVFLINYLNSVSNRTQFLTRKLYFLSFKTIKEKLANYILELSNKEKTTVELLKSHQELAELFGVARPSLSRGLAELEKEGIIKVNRKKIRIIDQQKLSQLLN